MFDLFKIGHISNSEITNTYYTSVGLLGLSAGQFVGHTFTDVHPERLRSQSYIYRQKHTMIDFICMGTNFRRLNENHTSVGSKFVDIVFSLIIHTENRYFLCSGIRGSDPPRKPRKLVPHKNHPQYIKTVVFCQYSVVEQGLSLSYVSHGAALFK